MIERNVQKRPLWLFQQGTAGTGKKQWISHLYTKVFFSCLPTWDLQISLRDKALTKAYRYCILHVSPLYNSPYSHWRPTVLQGLQQGSIHYSNTTKQQPQQNMEDHGHGQVVNLSQPTVQEKTILLFHQISVPDPDPPEPHVFGPPGSPYACTEEIPYCTLENYHLLS